MFFTGDDSHPFIKVPILMPVQLWALFVTWMGIVSIPMAKVNLEVFRMIFRRPLHIEIEADYRGAQRHHVILCTHQAFSTSYFSYRIWGMNVAIVNFFPIIVIAVIESYVMPEQYSLPPVAKFFVDLVCSVPIKFYIGMGISSISAQTNYMVGALLSATFGSITELILYGAAIRAGGLEKMVTYAVTGSILCDLLLLPGLSMIVGGFKFKDQKFNSVAAGVGSIMLFISVVGSFTPTVRYDLSSPSVSGISVPFCRVPCRYFITITVATISIVGSAKFSPRITQST